MDNISLKAKSDGSNALAIDKGQFRDGALDFVKVVAITLVIVVHLSAPVFVGFGGRLWFGGLFWRGISSICVPLFFLTIGAVLLGKDVSVGSVWRRVKRAAIPLFLWSLIYLTWDKYANGISTRGWLTTILVKPVSDLWFMYALIGFYIFLPAISIFKKYSTKEQRILFLAAWFVGVSVLPLYQKLHGGPVLAIDLSYAPLYGGYAILGSSLYGWLKDNRGRVNLIGSGLVAILALAFSILATWWLSNKRHAYAMDFFEYSSPLTIIAAAAAFVFLQLVYDRIGSAFTYFSVRVVGRRTLGIYLLQMLALHIIFFREFTYLWEIGAWVWVPLVAVLMLVLCTFVVSIIERIPLLRQLCPE